jgi:HK97 family phage major capsid protein
MALTLAQAALLTNDVYVKGVSQTIIAECYLMNWIPWFDLNGSALVWNEEATQGTPSTYWYAPGDAWQEATFTTAQKNKALTTLGGDADVDEFLRQTYRNPNDLVAEVIANKSKKVAYTFNDAFWNGDSAVTTNQFDGVKKYIGTGAQRMIAGATGAGLTLDMFDQLIDMVKPGKPDVIMVSRRTRRNLKKLWRAANSSVEQFDSFGQRVQAYDGIPVVMDDNILETEGNESGITGTNLTSMYALQFGINRGVVGLTNGGLMVEDIGNLETKNAHRYRIKWYAAVAVTRPIGVARLAGINGT